MARISGLISGLDTDSLIQELVSAYQTKQESYVKKQTKLEWTQETWKGLNTKVYSFYTGALRNARFSDTYNLKKATISNSSKATVTAANNAVVGTQTLKVTNLAKTAYLTGGKVKGYNSAKVTANSKLSDLEGLDETSSGTIKVNVNGKETEISVDGSMTVNQLVTKFKDAGLNANFDETNQRLFVSAKNSGADGEFSITAANAGGLEALTSLGLNAVATSDVASYREKADMNVQQMADTAYTKSVLTRANSELNTQLSELQNQYRYVTDEKYRDNQNTAWNSSIEEYQNKIDALNKNIEDILAYTGEDDTEGSALSIQTFVEKNGDGTYSYQSEYLKQVVGADGKPVVDSDGKPVMELNEAKVEETLKQAGSKLTVEDVKAQFAELNANVSQIQSTQAMKDSVQKTQELYQKALMDDPKGTGLESKIAALQKEIDTNNKLMANTYNFTENADDVSISYKDIDDNDVSMTYAELKEKLNSYAKSSLADGEHAVNFGNGLSGSKEYQSEYNLYQTKYSDEKSMAEKQLVDLKKQAGNVNMTDKELEDAIRAGKFNESDAVRVEGSDAEIVLNGAVFTSNTNNFAINGLTITATGLTADDEEVTINTTTDIDGMYDSVKKLITGYNEILKEMNTLYYADSSKGYEPLSDEEKDAMTDTEIEKWEKKIKDSLLRRDDTLNSIMSAISSSMSKSYMINGKSYSLSSFGISTSGYFSVDNDERGLYHIDGDSEDSSTSGNKDKLRAALASDPDTVIQFFQKVSEDMYSTLTKKMARTSLSSSYTIYNDKQMQQQYKDYDDIIDKWDEKIENYTQKYVKQFTAMETAMSKLQSSTSQLSSILG